MKTIKLRLPAVPRPPRALLRKRRLAGQEAGGTRAVPATLDLTTARASDPSRRAASARRADDGAAAAAPPVAPAAPLSPTRPSWLAALDGFLRERLQARRSRPMRAPRAAEWVRHMEDADFNDPVPPPQPAGGGGGARGAAADPEAVMMLSSMGFTEEQAKGALTATSGNLERAADWLFSHWTTSMAVAEALGREARAAEVEVPPKALQRCSTTAAVVYAHQHRLPHGLEHVVWALRVPPPRAGKWVLYNDRKVAPPRSRPRPRLHVPLPAQRRVTEERRGSTGAHWARQRGLARRL